MNKRPPISGHRVTVFNMLAVYSKELLNFGTLDSVYMQVHSSLFVEVISLMYSLTTHRVMVSVEVTTNEMFKYNNL